MDEFKGRYPYADFSKFYVDVDDNMHQGIYINAGNLWSVNVNDPVFLGSPYAKYLTINYHKKKDIVADFWKRKREEGLRLMNKERPKPSITDTPKPKPYKWPKIWNTGGDVPSYNGRASLGYSLQNFRVYINDKDYFMSNFPSVSGSWYKGKRFDETVVYDIRKAPLDYKKESYFAMICGAYVSSYLCGLSLQNIVGDVHPVIKTIVKYHFYYQIRKFKKTSNLLDKYNFFIIKGHIPTKTFWVTSKNPDEDGNIYQFYGHKEYSLYDYLSFISKKSNGLTKVGERLLQKSIESFVYAILGSQAKTRWAIVRNGAKSLQTQQVFCKIVEDTIIQNDTTVAISNMRTAIADTNVVLNLAICPGVILLPSSLIILEKPIPGYSNILKTTTSTMRFGVNSKVNYVGVLKPKPKKVHQTEAPIVQNHDTLGDSKHASKVLVKHTSEAPVVQNHDTLSDSKHTSKVSVKRTNEEPIVQRSEDYQTELVTILSLSSLATLLVVKYII